MTNKRRTGIYFMGSFHKGERAVSYFDSIKPFDIDVVEGTISPKVIHFFKKNICFNEWFFFEGETNKDCFKKQYNRDIANNMWLIWCKKHKRIYKPKFT